MFDAYEMVLHGASATYTASAYTYDLGFWRAILNIINHETEHHLSATSDIGDGGGGDGLAWWFEQSEDTLASFIQSFLHVGPVLLKT